MRDIRDDLRARLDEIEAEKAQLQRQMDTLSARKQGLRSLLFAEEQRWLNGRSPGHSGITAQRSTVNSGFLMRILSDGLPQRLEYLKGLAEAEGLDFGEKSAGRSLHWALAALKAKGWVEQTEDKQWKLSAGKLAELNKPSK